MWNPNQDIHGLDEAQDIIRANTSPRYKRLAWLESWVEGRQYDGLPNWWDDSVPLWERAPCIVYPVVDVAIQSNVDLVLGEGRFPSFSAGPGEDEGDDEESGLSEEASGIIDRALRDYHRQTQFRSHARDAFRAAQGCGTAVAIHGARNGRPFNELVPARWCEPKFDGDENVTLLTIRYPYVEVVRERDKWVAKVKLYRRDLTDSEDIVYFPADATKRGEEPSWQRDEKNSTQHGFGFCPVVWYPFMRGCVAVNEIDGKAIHRNLLDEIHQHDIARSQWHRGALFSEPQIVEIGVAHGYNPTAPGTTPGIPSVDEKGNVNGAYQSPGGRQVARKKGPGYPWQYEADKQTVDVRQLTYPGDALKSQQDNAGDLLTKLQEALAVVLLDPHNIKFAATTSGKALEAIKQRQIDRCDQYRDDLKDGLLLPSVDMQLRILNKLGDGLRVTKAADAQRVLAKFAEAA